MGEKSRKTARADVSVYGRRQRAFAGLYAEKNKLSGILSAASFYPLFTGLAEQRHADALVCNLERLEAAYGILTCEKNNARGTYQWDYPNDWACLQYIAIVGLIGTDTVILQSGLQKNMLLWLIRSMTKPVIFGRSIMLQKAV